MYSYELYITAFININNKRKIDIPFNMKIKIHIDCRKHTEALIIIFYLS